jgi:hypothetical protein
MIEKQLQAQVMQLAKLYGWRAYHTFLSIRSEPGFPDCVLVRDRVLYRELKTNSGKLTPAQKQWLDALLWAGQDASVWREDDLLNGRIVQELSRKRAVA